MKIKLLCVGKNNNSIWFDSMEHYSKRINQYVNFSIEYIPDVKTGKKSNPELVKNEEAKKLLLKIKTDDVVILLDEKGKAYSSKAFAETVEKQQNTGVRNLVFIIGGAFGFSENIYWISFMTCTKTGKWSLYPPVKPPHEKLRNG